MALSVDRFQNIFDMISKDSADVRNTLAFVGALVAAYYGGRIVMSTWRGIWTHIVSRLWPRDFVKEYGGSWAVVTGPTRGIGRAYANALARRGMNVALVGRDPTRLAEVKEEILKYGVKCEYFNVDFAVDDAKAIEEKLTDMLKLDIGVLINNAGWRNYAGPGFFHEIDKASIWPCVMVNCMSVAVMMRLVLPGMTQRKKGAVVNVCSLAGVFPLQFTGLYSSSKAFADFLTRATQYENFCSGITIQSLTPCYVFTGDHYYYNKPTLMTPSAETFVDFALSTLGFNSRTAGYPVHDFMMFGLLFFGDGVRRFLTSVKMRGLRYQVNKNK